MVRVYLAGPMSTGQDANGADQVPEARLDAFDRLEQWVRAAAMQWLPLTGRDHRESLTVYNPAAEFRRCPWMTRHAALRRDMAVLAYCDLLIAGDGYLLSKGCAVEIVVGHEMGLDGWHAAESRNRLVYELTRIF